MKEASCIMAVGGEVARTAQIALLIAMHYDMYMSIACFVTSVQAHVQNFVDFYMVCLFLKKRHTM